MQILPLETENLLPGIRRFNIFRYLGDEECRELLAGTRLLRYEENESIVQEGEISPLFYAITAGSVNIMVADRSGKEDRRVFICALGDGDVFGEAAIFSNKKRTAGALAGYDCTLLEFQRDTLMEFFRRRPTAGLKILMVVIHSLLNKLRDANQELAFEREASFVQQEVDDLINACFLEQLSPADSAKPADKGNA
jgi:CRP-like cAMP-binding protein